MGSIQPLMRPATGKLDVLLPILKIVHPVSRILVANQTYFKGDACFGSPIEAV